jgi:hypothetical protein
LVIIFVFEPVSRFIHMSSVIRLSFVIFSVLVTNIIASAVTSVNEVNEDADLITSSGIYLYDLSSDPYEDVDVSGSDDYTSILTKFEVRRNYWSELTIGDHGKR